MTLRVLQATKILAITILYSATVLAQTSLLEEIAAEDAPTTVLAYGDSLTYGVGDRFPPGEVREAVPIPIRPAGYPLRLQNLLGINVQNRGLPGDRLSDDEGLSRFPASLSTSNAQLVVIFEGENDAIFRITETTVETRLQKLINIAEHQGRKVLLATLPPPCCDRKERAVFTRSYSRRIRRLASINELPLVDLEEAWDEYCPIASECPLFNRPEGLHPNTLGYDFIAQMFSAVLIGIDITAPEGPAQLAQALGVDENDIIIGGTKDAIPTE